MRAQRAGVVFAIAGLLLPLVVLGQAQAEASCAPAAHAGGDWPNFGRDLANSRHQSLEQTIAPANVGSLSRAWVFSVADGGGLGTLESTPMVANGCVYIATQTGSVFAINADTGELVWKVDMPSTVTTLATANGRIFADVSELSSPYMVALDAFSGAELWRTTVDTQPGSDLTGSPVAFGDLVATGVSCIGAEGSSGPDRLACRGAFVILDQATGAILGKAHGIPDEDFARGFAGGGMWAAPAIDIETGYAYIGAGNPFSAQEHVRTNAMLKIDVDPGRPTFGQVVDSFKGNYDTYLPALGATKPACAATDSNAGACELLDLDWAMSPAIFHDTRGRKLVGSGQSSGIFHVMRADTMELVWQAVTAVAFGARAGGAAYDGTNLYTQGGPGTFWALEKDTGASAWTSLHGSGNFHTPVAAANGVVYTPHNGGLVLAYDAQTGSPLAVMVPALDAADVPTANQATGVSVARNTVYAPANGALSSYVVAYRRP